MSAGKPTLVIEYFKVNKCLEERSFRIEQLTDAAPFFHRDDLLFNEDVKEAYYHLRLRLHDDPYPTF